jgi:hypothetical protein
MDVLFQIKRLALFGRVEFTAKALLELEVDALTGDEVIESRVNAQRIDKVVRSRSRLRRSAHEKLYVIKSLSYGGTYIYTKGTILRHAEGDVFYILVSSKIATIGD